MFAHLSYGRSEIDLYLIDFGGIEIYRIFQQNCIFFPAFFFSEEILLVEVSFYFAKPML